MLDKFSHPMLYVTDLARAVKWYESNLNFEVRYHIPNSYASLYNKKINLRLDLHPSEANSKDVGFGCINYFETKNIELAIEELKSKNIKVGAPKQEGNSPRFVTFWDSEGNALGLIESQ